MLYIEVYINKGGRILTKIRLRIITAIVAVMGIAASMFGANVASRQHIYNPNAVTTVRNDTTGKLTQAYSIGNMQIYIDQTYRMDMPLWMLFVNAEGISYNSNFKQIEPGNPALSLNKDDSKISPSPFVMRLKIRNLSDKPISIKAGNFKIRTSQGEIYSPSEAWQKELARAGMFSGSNNQNVINPDDEKILWLVYGTKSAENGTQDTDKDYVRVNYGSDNDFLATKVEFPFNFDSTTSIGNVGQEIMYDYNIAVIASFVWLALCGFCYFKMSAWVKAKLPKEA